MQKEKNEFPDMWSFVNHKLKIYQLALLGLVLVGIALSVTVVALSSSDPVVIVMGENEKSYYQGVKKQDDLTEDDIKEFVRDFVDLRYRWKEFNPDFILKRISPLTTEEFRDRIKKLLQQGMNKSIKGKTLSQDISNLEVKLLDNKIFASFYKILTIDGVPFPVIPTEISLTLLKEASTDWNLRGLFVNGVIEHNEN